MKVVLKFLIVIGAVLCWHSTYACICGREAREWSVETVKLNIKRNDLIFIGDVINTEGNKYSFRVIEVFKGNIDSDTIHGEAMDGCSMTPYIDGLWIIYTHVDERGVFDLTVCNLSRSLTTFSALPPFPDSAITESLYTAIRGKELPVALRDWMNEYSMLVNLKVEETIPVTPEPVLYDGESSSNILTYVAVGLALIALIVALLKK